MYLWLQLILSVIYICVVALMSFSLHYTCEYFPPRNIIVFYALGKRVCNPGLANLWPASDFCAQQGAPTAIYNLLVCTLGKPTLRLHFDLIFRSHFYFTFNFALGRFFSSGWKFLSSYERYEKCIHTLYHQKRCRDNLNLLPKYSRSHSIHHRCVSEKI